MQGRFFRSFQISARWFIGALGFLRFCCERDWDCYLGVSRFEGPKPPPGPKPPTNHRGPEADSVGVPGIKEHTGNSTF